VASVRDRNRGFTILELILAGALGVVVLGGAYMVYDAGWSTVGRSERRADLQQNARAALDILVWQIRHAGYQSLGVAPDRIVIGENNLLVIRGDVQVTGALVLSDTLFGIQPNQSTICLAPPCLVTGTNVYTVAAAPVVAAFGVVTGLTFNYFDRNDVQLPAPLDGVTAGAFPDGTAAPSPLPGPAPCPASPQSTESCRNAVRRIQIVLTAVDRNVTAGPGPGSGVEQIVVSADVQLRNTN
jgi:hypothetical protein